VRVVVGEDVHRGLARGIDVDGALMLETPAGLLRFISGEVSVRPDG
jgi:BirA family biotin operon repressor/biotin-[acetyl-CoA-carboxylase] ligase